MSKHSTSSQSNSRYEQVARIDIKKVCLNCPVDIEKGAILFDRKIKANLLQLKLSNISDKTIKSVYIKIYCYDDSGDIIKTNNENSFDYAYVDINCSPHEIFGTQNPIILPSVVTRKLEIYINKVVLENDTVIRLEEENYIDIPNQIKIYEGIENKDELIRVAESLPLNNQLYPLTYIPQDYENGMWSCTCGRINVNTDSCVRCLRDKQLQFQVINNEYLKESNKEYLLNISRKRMEEEKTHEIELIKKRFMIKKILVFTSIMIVFIIIGTFFSTSYYKYHKAEKLMESNKYEDRQKALSIYSQLGDYKDSRFRVEHDSNKLGTVTRPIWEGKKISKVQISDAIVGLKSDGTIILEDFNDEQRKTEISKWNDIVDIAVWNNNVFGLKKDGTITYSLNPKYEKFQQNLNNVSGWRNIKKISAGAFATIGLKEDGTAVMAREKDEEGYSIPGWYDIVDIKCGSGFAAGLTKNGKVITLGFDKKIAEGINNWSDIIGISGVQDFVVGLKKDGTVVSSFPKNDIGLEISKWKDIIQVSAGGSMVVGIKKDGTIVTASNSNSNSSYSEIKSEVENWKNISQVVSQSGYATVGIKKDGTVVSISVSKQ